MKSLPLGRVLRLEALFVFPVELLMALLKLVERSRLQVLPIACRKAEELL